MIDAEQIRDSLKISYFNDKGEVAMKDIKIPESELFEWIECNPSDPDRVPGILSQKKNPVKKKQKRYLNRYRIMEFIRDLPEEDLATIFKPVNIQVTSHDIEVEIFDNEKPDPSNPNKKILTMSTCDDAYNIKLYTILPLTPYQIESMEQEINEYIKDAKIEKRVKVKLKHVAYESEYLMLKDFIECDSKSMHLITGWNYLVFDISYLIARANHIGLNPEKISPTHKIDRITIRNKYDKKAKHIAHVPLHKGIIDYMFLFEKWDTSIEIKSSASLDYASEEILGIKKVKYAGTLMDLYRKNFYKYAMYNIIDSILVEMIHHKIQTLKTMQAIAIEGKTKLLHAMFASILVESVFSEMYEMDNVVLIPSKTEKEGSYSGGYVYQPDLGFKDKVFIYDYQAMFPTLAMWLNAGTDTIIGKMIDSEYFEDYNGIKQRVDPKHHIVASSKVVYTKSKQSIVRKSISKMLAGRILDQKVSNEINLEIGVLEKLLKKS